MKILKPFIYCSIILSLACCKKKSDENTPVPEPKAPEKTSKSVRFASYNCSLNRNAAGKLLSDLSSQNNVQVGKVAEIIQINRPDVVALLEFDYDADGAGIQLFQKNYLSISRNGSTPIEYPYSYAVPTNTGYITPYDLNNDGKVALGDDAFGFGFYPGQYAFVVLSKYPIEKAAIRSFQNFLWNDMPEAMLPKKPGTDSMYYSSEELKILRLSSKNHVDVPINIDGTIVHALVSHPTPPVFDGPEDRNGKRNHDEIRLWADYVQNKDYMYDDRGMKGGLPATEKFVIMGDLNADPVDGEATGFPISQLIGNARISQEVLTGQFIPKSEGGKENVPKDPLRKNDKQDPSFDTAFWGLRADYVLPSSNMGVDSTGVFWPKTGDPLRRLVDQVEFVNTSSDHLLIWANIRVR